MENEQIVNLIIETEKLNCFLEHNQLIQANAINQKLNQILQDIVAKSEDPEKHALWSAFKTTFRINRYILSGDTKDAHKELIDLAKMIRK